jgi:hypothetical protein
MTLMTLTGCANDRAVIDIATNTARIATALNPRVRDMFPLLLPNRGTRCGARKCEIGARPASVRHASTMFLTSEQNRIAHEWRAVTSCASPVNCRSYYAAIAPQSQTIFWQICDMCAIKAWQN